MNYDYSLSSPVPGLRFCSVNTRQNFKVAVISARFALPLTGDIAARALLPFLLSAPARNIRPSPR